MQQNLACSGGRTSAPTTQDFRPHCVFIEARPHVSQASQLTQGSYGYSQGHGPQLTQGSYGYSQGHRPQPLLTEIPASQTRFARSAPGT